MYDDPMNLDDVWADEQRRRMALAYAGAPVVPDGNPAKIAPTPTAPAAPPPSDFAALAQRYLEAQKQDRQDATFSKAAAGLDAAARTINAGAGFNQPSMVGGPDVPSRAAGVLDAARIEAMGMKATKDGKPQKSTDPNSAESKRAQVQVKEILGDNISDSVLATMSEADAENILKYGTAKAQRGVQSRGQEITETGQKNTNARSIERTKQDDVHFWAKMQQDSEQFDVSDATRRYIAEQALKAAQAARDEAAATREKDKADATNVPGFEPTDGATPTPADAEKVKATNESATRMRGTVANLRALHKKYGEAPKGDGANLQQQALRAVQLEAKNIAGLGALSGPDFGLMQDLSAQDLNSIQEWVRRNFAGASLEQSLQGLETWMNTIVTSTAAARGYRPKASTPQRTTPDRVMPKDAAGNPTLDAPPPPGKVRVIINGKPMLFPPEQVEAVKKRAKDRGDKIEVHGG